MFRNTNAFRAWWHLEESDLQFPYLKRLALLGGTANHSRHFSFNGLRFAGLTFTRGLKLAAGGLLYSQSDKEYIMKSYRKAIGSVTLAVLAGYLIIPSGLKAAAAESAEITKLLADAKAEAVELKADSTNMESFTRSTTSWQSYASHLEMIKGHVNNAGKLLTKLKDIESTGAPWQQAAIKRIEPFLKEMADNTTLTIQRLNDNQTKVHFPEFKELVKANAALSTDLEAIIRDFVDYGNARHKFEELSEKLEVGR